MYSEANMQNFLPAIRRVASEQNDMEVIYPRPKRVRSAWIDSDFSTFVCLRYIMGANPNLVLKNVGKLLDVHA